MKNFFYISLLSALFLFSGSAICQVVISGKIIDATSKKPVEGAHISIAEKTEGTSSDKDGNFILDAKQIPVLLNISHVSYNEKIIQVSSLNEVTIELELMTYLINPVHVSGNEIKTVLDTNRLNIIDYEFYNESILLLTHNYTTSEYFLMLADYSGKPLGRKKLSIKPEKLFKDCMNFFHLVGKDFSYEIVIDKNQILLSNPMNTAKFNELLPRCIEELGGKYYFNQYLTKKQSLSYYYIENEKATPVKIKEVADEFAIKMWKDEARFATLGGIKYDEFDARFAELCVYKPVYAPLVKLNDTLYIFDYVNNYIEHYSPEHKIIRKIPIEYHKNKDWEKDLFIDEKENKLYVHFIKNGISMLREINVNSGLLGNPIKVPQMPFIENIKVHGGFIFFISKSNNENAVRKIYSKRIGE